MIIKTIKNLFSKKACCKGEAKSLLSVEHSISDLEYRIDIMEGCLVCNACETTAPEIFIVEEDGVKFRANAELKIKQNFDLILEAIDGCPHEVIKIVSNQNKSSAQQG